jgi:hypothetical protein
MSEFIERRIVTGLIVSNEFARKIVAYWRDDLLVAPELQKLARWCVDFYEQYHKVPDRDIEMIFFDHLRSNRISKPEGELIEQILTRISDDYERGDQYNAGYLFDRAVAYFRSREQENLKEQLEDLTDRGEVERADDLLRSYTPTSYITSLGLEVGSEEGYRAIEEAFSIVSQPVVKYPGAFGRMVNPHMIRGGFVAFLAPEKRGKTWLMMDIAFRGLRQKANVAFFQAGDLTQSQMLRRTCIYMSRRSDQEEYCKSYYRPVGDCVKNQFNTCHRSDRNCNFGIHDEEIDSFDEDPREFENYDKLSDLAKRNSKYQPCDSATCNERRGTVWLKKEPARQPLTAKLAVESARGFFDRYKRRFKVMTVPSDSLSADDLRGALDEWEHKDDFVPDIIVVDYADLMTARVAEFRHRIDAVWKGLRAISQERHSLVVTATQADARSYAQNTLNLSNYSEDKRKYAHVTAMYGLNQDPKGREKMLGIMRINELVVREGIFNANNDVIILQDLRSGRPFLESYDKLSHHMRGPAEAGPDC